MKESNQWNANEYNKNADFVSKLALPVVKLLAPKKDEKILDLGCGDGTLSVEIQKYGSQVIAVDLSVNMVKKSKTKGVEASVMSATQLVFYNEFDAVFSNAVLHWVTDASLAIKNVNQALKVNGRFVGEFGGYGNVHSLQEVIQTVFERHPEYGKFQNFWYFPKKEEYAELLVQCGFSVQYIEIIKRPTPIGDIKEWLDIFANGIMQNVPAAKKESFKKEVENILKPKLFTQEDGWVIDYVRLRFAAKKENNEK
jgi:2-isopropylmalate synthase